MHNTGVWKAAQALASHEMAAARYRTMSVGKR